MKRKPTQVTEENIRATYEYLKTNNDLSEEILDFMLESSLRALKVPNVIFIKKVALDDYQVALVKNGVTILDITECKPKDPDNEENVEKAKEHVAVTIDIKSLGALMNAVSDVNQLWNRPPAPFFSLSHDEDDD